MIYNKSITATVYIVNDGKVLLHKHKKYNTWFPTGGHLEPDELPHEAAIREAKEEAGLDIRLVETENVPHFDIGRVDRLPAPFCLYHEGDIEEQFLDFIYIGETTQTEFSPMISESKELRWFSVEELESENIKVHVKNTAITVLDYLGGAKDVIHTFFDFCSGIGGGRLGLEKAGLHCVGRSETSRLADTTYKLMHDTENDNNYGNLKKLGKNNLPNFDVLIAGFPCQTFSVIGRQEGFSDDRGQIIFQLSRIMREMQPKCFILENVKGLVTHDNGRTIKKIMEELNDSGYVASYRVLTSLNYRVPQMRQRVYFVGFRKDLNLDYSKFIWPEFVDKQPLSDFLVDDNAATEERLTILKYYLNNLVNQGKYTIDDLLKMEGKILDTRMNDLRIYDGRCPTLRAQRDGVLYVRDGRIYQLTGYEALLLQGFPKECADKVKDIVSDRHLLMQAGNAMTVDVIEALGKSIINFLNTLEV